MANQNIFQGKAYWAKIVGKPQGGYPNGKGPAEWSIDVAIDEKTKDRLLKEGIDAKYIKNKGDEKGDYIVFKRREIKQDGTAAKPFKIVDRVGKPWPEGKFIGNGSTINVRYVINEELNKPNALAFQVVELQEYAPENDFPTYEENENEEWS